MVPLSAPLRVPQRRGNDLRGPAAILFISRDTCSDRISQNFFVLVLVGCRTSIARYVEKGVSHRCA